MSQVLRSGVDYEAGTLNGETVREIYTVTGIAFRALFGYSPRANAEQLLSQQWNEKAPDSACAIWRFYRNSRLVPEEVAYWHQEHNGQRLRRVIHAGTIAKQLGLDSFCEVGAGIGTDGVALVRLGFECKYLAELNKDCLRMIDRLANFALCDDLTIVDLGQTVKEVAHHQFGPVDWLYSSDVFEHIHGLERWLDPWIQNFKAVIMYAPFGKSEKNASHTSYSKAQFNRFMVEQGFKKIKVRGLGIPPMVYRNAHS